MLTTYVISLEVIINIADRLLKTLVLPWAVYYPVVQTEIQG